MLKAQHKNYIWMVWVNSIVQLKIWFGQIRMMLYLIEKRLWVTRSLVFKPCGWQKDHQEQN